MGMDYPLLTVPHRRPLVFSRRCSILQVGQQRSSHIPALPLFPCPPRTTVHGPVFLLLFELPRLGGRFPIPPTRPTMDSGQFPRIFPMVSQLALSCLAHQCFRTVASYQMVASPLSLRDLVTPLDWTYRLSCLDNRSHGRIS